MAQTAILFSWIFCYHTYFVLQVYYDRFEDLNFMDDKLPIKTVKFMSLKILYMYGNTRPLPSDEIHNIHDMFNFGILHWL